MGSRRTADFFYLLAHTVAACIGGMLFGQRALSSSAIGIKSPFAFLLKEEAFLLGTAKGPASGGNAVPYLLYTTSRYLSSMQMSSCAKLDVPLKLYNLTARILGGSLSALRNRSASVA